MVEFTTQTWSFCAMFKVECLPRCLSEGDHGSSQVGQAVDSRRLHHVAVIGLRIVQNGYYMQKNTIFAINFQSNFPFGIKSGINVTCEWPNISQRHGAGYTMASPSPV